MLWGHVIYYSLGIVLFFFTLALTFYTMEAYDNAKKHPVLRILPLLGLLVFTILNATNGFQMLILTVLPVAAGVFFERLLDREMPIFSKKNLSPLFVLGIMAAGVLIGTILLRHLLGGISAGYANAYSTYDKPSAWFENLDTFFMHWFTLLGMNIAEKDPLFSLDSIVNLLRLGTALLLLVVPIIALCCYRKIQSKYTRVLLLGHIFLFAFLLFGTVCGRLGAANWRLTPLVGTSVLTSAAVIGEAWDQRKTAVCGARLGVLVLLVFTLLSGYNAKTVSDMPYDYGRDNNLHVLAETLEAEGLTYGYATFWQSQAITLISDSEVKCRGITVNKDEIVPYRYQSNEAHYRDQDGVSEYFVLLTIAEFNTVRSSDYWVNLTANSFVRQISVGEYYCIFVFSDNIFEAGEVE